MVKDHAAQVCALTYWVKSTRQGYRYMTEKLMRLSSLSFNEEEFKNEFMHTYWHWLNETGKEASENTLNEFNDICRYECARRFLENSKPKD